MSSGGWLTTKKRGRDDDQIVRDRMRALESRRPKSKVRSPRKPPINARSKSSTKKTFKDNLDNFIDEDDDDPEDEVLTEDDEELLCDDSEDEDEELDERKPNAKRSKVIKRKLHPPSDDDDDSIEEETGTFFGSYPTRSSRPPPALRKISRSLTPPTASGARQIIKPKHSASRPFAKMAKGRALSQGKQTKSNTTSSKQKTEIHDLMSSDDDSLSVGPNPRVSTKTTSSRFFPPPARVSTTTTTTAREPLSANDSMASSTSALPSDSRKSSSLETKSRLSNGSELSASRPTFKKLSTKKLVIHDSDDDDDVNNWAVATMPRPTKQTQSMLKYNDFDDDDDDDDELPVVVPKLMVAKKKFVVREDDEISPAVNRSFQQQHSHLDDSSMDDDEAIALAWALEASQKETNAKTIESPPVAIDKMTKAETFEVIQEDDEQGDANQDRPSEDALVAGVVLATANSLSSQVLQTMLRWSQHHHSGPTTDETSKVPQGLLVDGALSLHSTVGDSPDPMWISRDLIQTICPLVQLKDYQLIGVNWLALLHRMKCQIKGKTYTHVNGILADEMGLGKTVQTIAFLAWLKYTDGNGKLLTSNKQEAAMRNSLSDDESLNEDRHVVSLVNSDDEDPPTNRPNRSFSPHIIVTPNSVLSNWKREFERFCPEMNVVMYNGNTEDRKEIRNELREYFSHQRRRDNPPDVILTSNSYFSSELADDRTFFRKLHFDYMVIDEGHMLKSPTSKRYKSLDVLRTNHRLLLTGTPVQNSPKELMALLCFLMPLFSGRSSNHDHVSNDGGKSMLQHFVKLEKGGGTDKTAYARLKQLFAPFVLRRTKIEVLTQILPEKERRVEILALDPASLALYNSVLATHCKKAPKVKGETDVRALRWSLFTDLRKSANHPLLLRTRHNTPEEILHLAKSFMMYGYYSGDACTLDKVKEELENLNDLDIHLAALELIEENPRREMELSRYVLEEDDLFSSAKFVRLRQLLPELISGGHRVLIFSQWTRVMDLLGILLENLGLQFLRLDGSIATSTRQALIDRFNEDNSIQVFLLSTRAGGLGINLTSADTCIIHDLDFNPFNDLQAEDRCHRIGQKNKVTVIKMVTKDTVDESIYNLQQRKAEMNAAIMENPDSAEWFKKAQVSDMECILQTALDQFRSSSFGKKLAVAAAPVAPTLALDRDVGEEVINLDVADDGDDDVSRSHVKLDPPRTAREGEYMKENVMAGQVTAKPVLDNNNVVLEEEKVCEKPSTTQTEISI